MAGEPGQCLERLTGCLDVLFGHWNLVPKPGEVPDCSGVPLCWTLSSSMGACSQQVCRLIHGCTGHGFGSKSQSETDWFRFSFFRELRGYTLHRLISASMDQWIAKITCRHQSSRGFMDGWNHQPARVLSASYHQINLPKFRQSAPVLGWTHYSQLCFPFSGWFSQFSPQTAEWSLIPEALLPGLRGLWLFTLWLSQRAPELQLSSTGSGWFWVDQGVQCYPPWQ